PDTTAPTVAVTAPAADTEVKGTTDVQATAVDDTAVASVQFKLDGQPLGDPDTQAPYTTTWDSTTADDGPHTLTAEATDAAGNKATSAPLRPTTTHAPPPDTTPPTVAITTPTANTELKGSTGITATASDDAAVASVQFKLD